MKKLSESVIETYYMVGAVEIDRVIRNFTKTSRRVPLFMLMADMAKAFDSFLLSKTETSVAMFDRLREAAVTINTFLPSNTTLLSEARFLVGLSGQHKLSMLVSVNDAAMLGQWSRETVDALSCFDGGFEIKTSAATGSLAGREVVSEFTKRLHGDVVLFDRGDRTYLNWA